MVEHGICDQCRDRKNPVTKENGGTLSRVTAGGKQSIADVHTACRAAWLNKNDAADYAGLEPVHPGAEIRKAGIMATEQIWEEAFKVGFKAGYINGRVAELAPSDIKTNAEAAYQVWLKEREPVTIGCGTST